MRPGHCAPEKGGSQSPAPGVRPASMRPGHCAPEKGPTAYRRVATTSGFNEAGALCPGKGRRASCTVGGATALQ